MSSEKEFRTSTGFTGKVKFPLESNISRGFAGVVYLWVWMNLFAFVFFSIWCHSWKTGTQRGVFIGCEVLICIGTILYGCRSLIPSIYATYGFNKEYVTRRVSFWKKNRKRFRWDDISEIEISRTWMDTIFNTWSAKLFSLNEDYCLELPFIRNEDFPVEILLERINVTDFDYSHKVNSKWSVKGILSSWYTFVFCVVEAQLYSLTVLLWPDQGPADESRIYGAWLLFQFVAIVGIFTLIWAILGLARHKVELSSTHLQCTSGTLLSAEHYVPYTSIVGTTITHNLFSPSGNISINIAGAHHSNTLYEGTLIPGDVRDLDTPPVPTLNSFLLPLVDDPEFLASLLLEKSLEYHQMYRYAGDIARGELIACPSVRSASYGTFFCIIMGTAFIGLILAGFPFLRHFNGSDIFDLARKAYRSYGHISPVIVFLLPSIVYGIPLAICSFIQIRWIKYRVNSNSIIAEDGLMFKTIDSMHMHKVDEMYSNPSFLYFDGKVSDLVFHSEGPGIREMKFRALNNHIEVRDFVLHLVPPVSG
jgi:membrane protein YdbS with pleckstrin-like domain